jgi:hypothetical protein
VHFSLLSQPTVTTVPTITSEELRNDSVVVTLELMTVKNSVISVESQPQAQNISNLDPRHVLLTLPYNTFYNVSIIATLCGQSTSNIIELHYGKSISTLYW